MSVPRISHFQRAPLLSAEDERRLAQAIEAGREAEARLQADEGRPGDDALASEGQAAKQAFVNANIRLVLSLARRFRTPNHVDRNDVIQDGIVGLERAVDRFDWRKGYKFSTYATWWIRQGMQRGLENTAATVRIPAHRSSELRVALATQTDGAAPLPDRLRHLATMSSFDSLDRTGGADDDRALADSLASADPGPDALVEMANDHDAARQLLRSLDPVTRSIVERRFGFGSEPPQTYASLATEFSMSHESVRRRVLKALDRLRADAEALAAA